MADFSKYFPTLLKLEGGFVDDPLDHGGATNLGVTIAEWIKNGYDIDNDGDIDVADLKKITKEDASKIAKSLYWDKVKGDKINSQSVAEFLADWAYNSGVFTPSKKIQRLVGAEVDGVIGSQSIELINNTDPKSLFEALKESRIKFYYSIVENNPSQKKFLKGWLIRANSFKFKDY